MGKGRNKKSRNTKPIQQQVNKTHPNVNKPSGKVENIVSKTAEEVSKVKALTKEEDIAVAKVKSSDVPPQVDNKVLNKIWINLESTKRTYNRLKEKYENLYLTIKIENDSLKDESKKLKELDITLKNREEELSKKDKNIIDRERKLTEKEVNAKTGFLKENIEALSALEDEKNLLEEKIKKLHKNYSTKIPGLPGLDFLEICFGSCLSLSLTAKTLTVFPTLELIFSSSKNSFSKGIT